MPLAVFIERVKNLPKQMIIFPKCQVAEMFQKQFVEHGLKKKIQSDERIAPVINNQQFLNDFPQGLPHEVAETSQIMRSPRGREEVPVQLSRLLDAHQIIVGQTRKLARQRGRTWRRWH